MSGAYCRYCDRRCFVYRELPDGTWHGHMATCPDGMAHDRKVTGYDHTTAINPRERDLTGLDPSEVVAAAPNDEKRMWLCSRCGVPVSLIEPCSRHADRKAGQ